MHPIHPVLWYYCHSKSYLCIFYHFLQTQSYRNSCMNPTCFGMRRVQNIREYFFHIRNHLQPKFNNSTLFKEGNIDLLNRDINKKKILTNTIIAERYKAGLAWAGVWSNCVFAKGVGFVAPVDSLCTFVNIWRYINYVRWYMSEM